MFKTVMIVTAVVSGALTALFGGLYLFIPLGWIETLAITVGTCFYHFAMRLAVGTAFIPFQKHDPHSRWFREKPFEKRLYKRLNVRHWKDRMPTYDQTAFDTESRSLDDIVVSMCHSELVHETIALLSFLPLLAAVPFGAFPVFLVTSLLSAMFDLSFVAMQRYNRPRVLKVIARQNRNT